MVVATVKVKLRKTGCKRPGRQQYDVQKKLQKPKIKNTFVLQLKNKFQALANMEDHTKLESLKMLTPGGKIVYIPVVYECYLFVLYR